MGSTQRIGSIADSYGIFTYKDDLVYFMVENHDNWQDRELALRLDPFIKAYIKRLDEEIWAENPTTTPDIFQTAEQDQQKLQLLNGNGNVVPTENEEESDLEEEPIESETTNVLEDWTHENWNHLCAKIFDKSRVHSKSVIKLYNAPPYWRVYCDREIKNIDYDDNNIPTAVDVEFSRSLPHSDKFMQYKEHITLYTPNMSLGDLQEDAAYGLLVPFGVAESEDQFGEFDLEDKWTLAIRIRYAQLDIANNSSKTSGFYHVFMAMRLVLLKSLM